ncbi:tRNA 2-selenouridine(34) synthase MnmH [Alkalihalophilus lindianensis]|uniref:tRNA 2-selenouridine(34) synthase MnmH n=1 Tax=Alkalihalophilus lindianensis TaxID=1630542 RepID=A0ABU3XCB9_9BACI|nr:tRNA 2-selenouridine(34) synthase MnmH [Alkalihalophilus lindianensis]MDV2685535.1 tRNA 2-selenouridine(34) synthase MnmH [Alkalihalophilus lindianensis]
MTTIDVQKVTYNQLDDEKDVYIDVRSPREFAEYSLPSAINIPLFSNEERAKIGYIYKQESRENAVEKGLELFSMKLPLFYRELKILFQSNPQKRMIVYCWRGGMRSKTIAGTLSLLGIPCFQLEGGIRSYRTFIQEFLAKQMEVGRQFVVLAGPSGSRKTEILDHLEDKGYPVVNLEKLANHRGSLFGHIGLTPHSQKEFEARLVRRLIEFEHASHLIIEAESKRIGRVVVPSFILKGKEEGRIIEIDTPFHDRIHHIHQTYRPDLHKDEFGEAISYLRKRLSHPVYMEVRRAYDENRFDDLFTLLLECYYDPRYEFKQGVDRAKGSSISFHPFEEGLSSLEKELDQLIHHSHER